MPRIQRTLWLLSLMLVVPAAARAEPLTFSFTDRLEDQFGVAPDWTGLIFHFDNTTGAYERLRCWPRPPIPSNRSPSGCLW